MQIKNKQLFILSLIWVTSGIVISFTEKDYTLGLVCVGFGITWMNYSIKEY